MVECHFKKEFIYGEENFVQGCVNVIGSYDTCAQGERTNDTRLIWHIMPLKSG